MSKPPYYAVVLWLSAWLVSCAVFALAGLVVVRGDRPKAVVLALVGLLPVFVAASDREANGWGEP